MQTGKLRSAIGYVLAAAPSAVEYERLNYILAAAEGESLDEEGVPIFGGTFRKVEWGVELDGLRPILDGTAKGGGRAPLTDKDKTYLDNAVRDFCDERSLAAGRARYTLNHFWHNTPLGGKINMCGYFSLLLLS